MVRLVAVIAGSLLVAVACGGGTDTGTATSSAPATATTSPTVTTASTPSSPAATGTTQLATTTEATPSEERDLVGQVLDTLWIDDGVTQIYILDDTPTGLTSGARLPLAWAGDQTSFRLGFADWSGVGRWRGPYDQTWDGELLLLEVVGRRGPWERFLVHDRVSLTVPAADGLAGAMCFEGGVPHAVRVRFSDDGPVVAEAWRPDAEAMELQPVDPTAIDCPDLRARPRGPGPEGTIITASGRDALSDECGDFIDLSGSTPVELPYASLAGCIIDDIGTGDDHALGVLGDPTAGPDHGWVQLEAFLGWDYTGSPIFRVVDALPFSDLDAISIECFTPTGTPAVALVERTPVAPIPTAAWTVSDDRTQLITADPSDITCGYVGD